MLFIESKPCGSWHNDKNVISYNVSKNLKACHNHIHFSSNQGKLVRTNGIALADTHI